MMTDSPYVLTEVEDRIGWLILNDPDRLNPVGGERISIAAINAAAQALSARDDVHVVIVTGAGRGFSSGADLARGFGFARTDASQARGFPPASGSLLGEGSGLWTLTAMRQPVIAMVNGPAVGYGFELALQADIRIAGRSARFGLPFAKLGVVSDTGAGSWLLPRLVGYGRAAEILYTARLFSADEVASFGLLNRVVEDEALREVTVALAREIAQNAAWSLRTMKRMLFDGLEESRKAHVLEQYLRFREGPRDIDPALYAGRFRKDESSAAP
jgi:enoyl-CoA hydratase/carnithine racemase